MNISILSRMPRSYSTRRLRQAATARGHKVRVLDTLGLSIHMDPEEPEILYRGRRLGAVDAVIPRIGVSITHFGCAVLRQFQQIGIFSLNDAEAILVARDKLRSLQVLARQGIPMPPTAFAFRKKDILPAIDSVGGPPIVIKTLEGTHGVGVVLADTQKMAEAVIEALHSARQSVLVQKFIAESKGRDVRAIVVGDKVVAAMRRRAQGQEFRSNVHRGGTAEPVELDEAFTDAALRSTHLLGLEIAGVDILEGEDGPKVMEVNASPGLQGIETTTGIDVASMMIEHLEQASHFPELELRERLKLRRGFTIADLMVSADSEMAGRTLGDLGLRERDVVVLSVRRGGTYLANPRGDEEIMVGDALTCYGPEVVLRGMVPPPKPRRGRRKKTSGARRASTGPA